MVEPSFLAPTTTPSIAPSFCELTCPVNAKGGELFACVDSDAARSSAVAKTMMRNTFVCIDILPWTKVRHSSCKSLAGASISTGFRLPSRSIRWGAVQGSGFKSSRFGVSNTQTHTLLPGQRLAASRAVYLTIIFGKCRAPFALLLESKDPQLRSKRHHDPPCRFVSPRRWRDEDPFRVSFHPR